jgi:hypothetical protein
MHQERVQEQDPFLQKAVVLFQSVPSFYKQDTLKERQAKDERWCCFNQYANGEAALASGEAQAKPIQSKKPSEVTKI